MPYFAWEPANYAIVVGGAAFTHKTPKKQKTNKKTQTKLNKKHTNVCRILNKLQKQN